MPDLEIQLLGAFQLRHRGELVTTLVSPRQQALLAWLLLHGPSPQSRRHIAFALWPDSEEAQALTNLRRELHGVRRALPWAEDFIEVTPSALRWRHDASFSLDVATLGASSGSGSHTADLDALERAIPQSTGRCCPASTTNGWHRCGKRCSSGRPSCSNCWSKAQTGPVTGPAPCGTHSG